MTKGQNQSLRFAFYNVENLFHPDWDSLNPDEEFRPEGRREWNYFKYKERLKRLSKVIISLSDSSYSPPALVAFAEIESKKVLSDLIGTGYFQKLNYQLVHYDSPDRRGIDVGLIYQRHKLKLIQSKTIPYKDSTNPNYRSRDMLFASFETSNQDTIQFIICHWPSRFGGQIKSMPKRLNAAIILSNFIDSIQGQTKSPLVIMGDFNDSPQDSSITTLCRNGSLKNLMLDLDPKLGSHRYKGEWSYLDQILVSAGDIKFVESLGVFQAPFLLEPQGRLPGMKPKRAFQGPFFTKGFSDHLPIYLDWSLAPNLH